MGKKNFYLIGLAFIISTIVAVFSTNIYINNKQKEILKKVYDSRHKTIFEKTQSLINDKQNTSLAIAISLSKDENLYNNLKNKEFDKLNYKEIAKLIETNSKYKNIWIQIFDENRNSIYRSWTQIRDGVQFRGDLKNISALKNISTSISAGLFNVGIKARTPIFDENNNFYGALEVVTHFDSISDDLQKNGVYTIVIGDKRIRKNLKYPLLSQLFIDDYYIVNENVNKKLFDYIKENGIEHYINIKDYIVENNYLISKYPLFDEQNKELAYILNFIEISSIDLNNIKYIKIQSIMASVIALIIIFTFILVYYIKQIKYQDTKNKVLLDSQPNIIIITNGEKIVDANKQLFKFFPSAKNIEDFINKYVCICNFFEVMDNEEYIENKLYDGNNWCEHIFLNQNKNFKVAIKNSNNELRHFNVKTSKVKLGANLIVTFIDITNEILQKEKEINTQKAIFQQSKINAVINTLNNIAHQWRQPLGIISTIASGIKLKNSIKSLTDKEFDESCDKIIYNTQKLSNTIENFTDFFTKDSSSSSISIIESTNQIIKFLSSVFEKNSIICKFNYDKDLMIECNSGSFTEAILNLLDNSIYSLIQNNKENNRFIFIDFKDSKLSIKDNAGGVDEAILSKILEPYFTTKHQSFGTGLGLYIVQEIFVRNHNFKSDLRNETFIYNDKENRGLNFIIDFS
ncbi:sensor histidine kinase [Aliarcobacter lanthieri]|uniref:PAS domain-containing sensor histidine kinase n=1 Tax=Aliarcobacter lanthieri TaxID=1355374 RepID=UPI003AFB0B38